MFTASHCYSIFGRYETDNKCQTCKHLQTLQRSLSHIIKPRQTFSPQTLIVCPNATSDSIIFSPRRSGGAAHVFRLSITPTIFFYKIKMKQDGALINYFFPNGGKKYERHKSSSSQSNRYCSASCIIQVA